MIRNYGTFCHRLVAYERSLRGVGPLRVLGPHGPTSRMGCPQRPANLKGGAHAHPAPTPPPRLRPWLHLQPGPEEFVNLQGLLVQSSKWFRISSAQFSSLVTSLPGQFVQFILGHRGQVPPFSSFSSVHLVQITNSSGSDSDWPG